MNPRKFAQLILLVGLQALFLMSCATKQYFTIDSATYQPAVFNESSRITTIEVIVSNVDTNVVFTDLVFQNLRIPVMSEDLPGKKVKVSGYIQIGGKLADDQYQIMTEEENKLRFEVDKSQRSIPLENIERQRTELP